MSAEHSPPKTASNPWRDISRLALRAGIPEEKKVRVRSESEQNRSIKNNHKRFEVVLFSDL
jgi:hypothetical protein